MSAREVKVAVAKETRDTLLGITLRQESDEEILINTIATDSLFANTRLKPGMEVLKINGVAVDCLSLAQIMKTLRNTEDVVTIEACDIDEKRSIGTQKSAASSVPASTSSSTPVPDGTDNGPPAIYESNEEATLIVQTSNEDTSTLRGTAPPPNLEGMPVARAEAVVDSTCGATTIDADPVVAAYATSLSDISPITPRDNGFIGSVGVLRDTIEQNGLVTVTVSKSTPESSTGLGLKTLPGGGVVISSLKTFSTFNGTNLRRGMKVLRVNGQDCSNKSAVDVAALLKTSGREITVVAGDASSNASEAMGFTTPGHFPLVTVRLVKLKKGTKIGIGLRGVRTTSQADVPMISSIEPNGLSANTSLKVGMRILAVNGVHCVGQKDTLAKLGATQGVLKILAGSLRCTAVTVTKTSNHKKVGLVMRQERGVTIISNLPRDGLFARTSLKNGMLIHQINGKSVLGLRLDFVSALISNSPRTVTVVAEDVSAAGL